MVTYPAIHPSICQSIWISNQYDELTGINRDTVSQNRELVSLPLWQSQESLTASLTWISSMKMPHQVSLGMRRMSLPRFGSHLTVIFSSMQPPRHRQSLGVGSAPLSQVFIAIVGPSSDGYPKFSMPEAGSSFATGNGPDEVVR